MSSTDPTHHAWLAIALFLGSAIVMSAAYEGPDLPRGPFCSSRRTGCCDGRVDDCGAPILGTICYCDDFCNRTRNEDCCPDYWSFCKGVEPPEPLYGGTCPGPDGIEHPHDTIIKINCNECKCNALRLKPEFLCEVDECLVDQNVIDGVNSQSRRLGWTARNYTEFWGHKLQEGIILRLGTLQPHRVSHRMSQNAVRKIYNTTLPRDFKVEEKWGWISPIKDQGWCGSSWAVSTAAVATDRLAIMSRGREQVELSAQQLLSCNSRGQQKCHGGYLDRAWMYFWKTGVVDETCYPYSASEKKCHLPRRPTFKSAGCAPPSGVQRTELYKAGPAYRLNNITDIMDEILLSGPVQATMKVYQDFFAYSGGIYKHSAAGSIKSGYHSVRIVGWGEEWVGPVNTKYWIVANSWGTHWGENGFFRIVRGSNECEIESFVIGAWAKTVVDFE